jgi:hypothetical protein
VGAVVEVVVVVVAVDAVVNASKNARKSIHSTWGNIAILQKSLVTKIDSQQSEIQ